MACGTGGGLFALMGGVQKLQKAAGLGVEAFRDEAIQAQPRQLKPGSVEGGPSGLIPAPAGAHHEIAHEDRQRLRRHLGRDRRQVLGRRRHQDAIGVDHEGRRKVQDGSGTGVGVGQSKAPPLAPERYFGAGSTPYFNILCCYRYGRPGCAVNRKC